MPDQAEQLRNKMSHFPPGVDSQPHPHRVVAVASGKGGVGKSNFCINFALGLKAAGYRPIVVDADVGFANVEVLLGVQPTKTIMDVLLGFTIWDIVQFSAVGLPFLSAGNGLTDIHSLTPGDMDHMLLEMRKLHDQFDTVILDCGAGMSVNIARLLGAADDLILMTTPEPTAITDAYALLKLLAARGELPPTQLVVNRADRLTDGRLAADKLRVVAERFLNVSLGTLGFILEDDAVQKSVMRQEALLTAHPSSPAARCVTQLVRNFVRVETKYPRLGLFGFFDRLFGRGQAGAQIDSGHPA